MKSAGIDIGSRYIKLVIMEGGNPLKFRRVETSFNPLEKCAELLKEADAGRAVATGYGRHLLESHMGLKTITEIKAFACGARALFPACRTVIDIGGQDTKVISLDKEGIVRKFEMNDKCSAGTGRFLEIMAKALGYSVEEFGFIDPEGPENIRINSICTVFAESEVISLIARGLLREDITRALHRLVAGRVLAMLGRIPVEEDIVFAGGCAGNPCLKKFISQGAKTTVHSPELPEMTGALGAAIYAEAGL